MNSIYKNWKKTVSLKEYLDIRSRLLLRARSRSKTFNDNHKNYYWYQIENLDNQYPEFKHLGMIRIKK